MKRTLLAVLVASVVACGAILFLTMRPPRAKPALSFVVIVVDSMRADHVGAYGYPRATTPRIDALARDGLLAESASSQAPWTKPSVASIFTSTYISVHRVLYSRQIVDGEERSDVLSDKFLTLAEAMKAGGYATGGFGQKIHLRPGFGFDQGFEGYDMRLRRAEKINRGALGWLADRDPDRFFLYIHYNDPHYPYTPRSGYANFGTTEPRVQINGDTKRAFRAGSLELTPEDMRQLSDLYDGEIRYTDEHIGALLDGIAGLGFTNVMAIVTADHGEEFLDHGDITHGQSLYQELVRVPLVIGGSGLPKGARGIRSDASLELIDIMPTLLDLAGLPEPPGLQGGSFRLLLDETDGVTPEPVFGERRDEGETRFWSTIVDGRWKLIEDPDAPGGMLFDLGSDPGETLRVEDRNPDVVSGLRSALSEWSEKNRILYERIRPEDTTPLDPETEERLRSLGYIN